MKREPAHDQRIDWSSTRMDAARQRPMRVFVHLARNKDAEQWRRDRESGRLVGFNDETPYGYGRARAMGCQVTFSRSSPETVAGKLVRLALRAIFGFDFIHAWQQRAAFADADIIWTHTESQYLAVSAVIALTGSKTKLLGQTVWLMDRWRSLWFAHRLIYRTLIDRVDVLTFLSHENAAVARALFPRADIRVLPFGIGSETKLEPRPRKGRPIRVLAVGNDRDRDWRTLIDAVRHCSEMSVLIFSGSISPRIARGVTNVEIRTARTNEELKQAYNEATVVCVPLRSNLHASGITAMQEAVLAGVPVVATETGGLSSYFPPDEVTYVPPGEPQLLRQALIETALDQDASCERARRAQARMHGRGRLGADAYIRLHVELSEEVTSR